MNKTCLWCLMILLVTTLGTAQPAAAQQPTPVDMLATDDPTTPSVSSEDILSACQDSLLLEPFPMLRMFIDLITQLLELLERVDQQLSDLTSIDSPASDPAIPSGSNVVDPTTLDPAAISSAVVSPSGAPTTVPAGGFGVGPVPSLK